MPETMLYPQPVRLMATLLNLSPAQAFLAGRAAAFTYRRGPHLTPPHQIDGLVPEYERRLCEQLGLTCHKHVVSQRETGRATLEALLAEHAPLLLVVGHETLALHALHNDVAIVQTPTTREEHPWHEVEARWWDGLYAGTFYAVDWQPVQVEWSALLRKALVANAHDMLVCSGWWYGVDGIEFWSEDVVRWQEEPQWALSAATMSRQIETEALLWRRTLADALSEHADVLGNSARLISALDEVCERWQQIAAMLADAAATADPQALVRLSAPLLRLAHAESRFWSRIVDTFGMGI